MDCYSNGLKLLKWYQKCMETDGDYVEKQSFKKTELTLKKIL